MVDIDLIKRCQAREPDAFDRLYRLYATKALRTAYLITGRKSTAEDAMQEAFFECYRDIGTLHKPELFQVWFHRLLVRICWRISAKDRKTVCEDIEKLDTGIISAGPDVAELAVQNQINCKIRETIMQLDEKLRVTMILYYYNELTIKEIAQVISCSPGTVKSRLHNGKKKLARELTKEMDPIQPKKLGYLGKEAGIQ